MNQSFGVIRIFNFLLALMFLVFAFLQVNDPDPVVWILIYGAMAVVSVLAMFEFYRWKYLAALGIILLLYSLVFIPGFMEWLRQPDKSALFDDLAKMEHPYIEESREFLGIMICEAVLIFQIVRSMRRS